MADLVEDGNGAASLSSSQGRFFFPCDPLGGSWASDGVAHCCQARELKARQPWQTAAVPLQSLAQRDYEAPGNSRTNNFQRNHMDLGNEHLVVFVWIEVQRSFPKMYT